MEYNTQEKKKILICTHSYSEIETLDLYIHILLMQWSLDYFQWRELVRNQLVGIQSRSHSAAVSADSGSAAWGLLIIDSDQCLGHSDGTVVKADKSHFTLLINLLLLKLSRFPVIFEMTTRWRQMFFVFCFFLQ